MPAKKNITLPHETLIPANGKRRQNADTSLRGPTSSRKEKARTSNQFDSELDATVGERAVPREGIPGMSSSQSVSSVHEIDRGDGSEQLPDKLKRRYDRARELLRSESWPIRSGHRLTYAGLFIFTLTLYFRPYELVPGLSGFRSMALVVACATFLVYLPTQVSTYGTLTTFSTETKCVLFLALWALLTIPLSLDPGGAWKEFHTTFVKVVIIFVIMVNVLRTPAQLKGLIWLGIGVGVLLSYQALELSRQGKFSVEGYRVGVDFGGMFGNPNDIAIHLVIFAPISLALGLAAKTRIARIIYYIAAGVMVVGTFVTQSRGGFLGLLAVSLVLMWKLGKGKRVRVLVISLFLVILFLGFAPGDYGTRIGSIFFPSLDPVGSSDARRDMLTRSLLVTARNPIGIGIGNFPIVGYRNLVTHNAYTQVSAELGWLALMAYVVFLVSPLRKLGAVERLLNPQKGSAWIYYLSVGVQASIVGYMVSSFFASVAYQWYVYYPVAFAVCLRRIYRGENERPENEVIEAT